MIRAAGARDTTARALAIDSLRTSASGFSSGSGDSSILGLRTRNSTDNCPSKRCRKGEEDAKTSSICGSIFDTCVPNEYHPFLQRAALNHNLSSAAALFRTPHSKIRDCPWPFKRIERLRRSEECAAPMMHSRSPHCRSTLYRANCIGVTILAPTVFIGDAR